MRMTRRQAITGMLASASFSAMASDQRKFDPDFGTGAAAAEAIRKKQVSSVELTTHILDRIAKYNDKLNAFVYVMRDEALAAADAADKALAQNRTLGPLHGVPINVKESFAVAGRPCTWGIPDLKNVKASANSDLVQKFIDAGAVLTGATNVPVNLEDYQSDNPVYGRTGNPWDLSRTPGGSSGGAAASLAAGLGFLSAGSDIGGSIRVPAHFCGIFGHKPTIDLVSMAGHLPGGMRPSPGFSTDLAVAGPMARSADDLLLALKFLGGPTEPESIAFRWSLPNPRHPTLRDYRIGYVIEDPIAPLSSDLKPAFDNLLRTLEKSGARLVPGWPEGFKPAVLNETYVFMLSSVLFSVAPPEAQARMAEASRGSNDPYALGTRATHAEWMRKNLMRLGWRAQWQRYFSDIDAFLCPVSFSAAFSHNIEKKTISTPEGDRPYMDTMNWIGLASLTGLPATAAPIGKTQSGLPVGVQVIGPMWEDATPITLAGLISQEACGGFTPPPGFRA
jgi:amidase